MSKPTNTDDFISELGGGAVQAALAQLISSVATNTCIYGGKKTGQVSLDLKFARIGDEGSTQVKITATIANSKPTARGKESSDAAYETVFFVSAEQGVTIHQPRVNMEQYNEQ